MSYNELYLTGCNPEQLLHVIDQAEMWHQILPGGELTVATQSLVLENAVLQRGYYGMGTLAKGAWPEGLVCLGMVVDAPAQVAVNGFLCPAGSVQIYSEGEELCYRAPPGSTWFAYCAKREFIQSQIVALCGREMPIPDQGTSSVTVATAPRHRLVQLVNELFYAGKSPELSDYGKQRLEDVEREFLFAFAGSALAQLPVSRASGVRCARDRRRLMHRIDRFYQKQFSEPFRVGNFAENVGCSERMLEYQCKQLYGMSPTALFRTMRLNGIRQELLRATAKNQRIGELAMHWGFAHLGRFSVEYRTLFGESPKDTLAARKHRPCDSPN